ncbi:MAG: hypothetical protein H0U28_00370 [Nocardioidaceae bacterium]|nr:hypothetical protein [Nocardioidaceae bacterium]
MIYPGSKPAAHFLASMDLRESGFKGHQYPGAEGMWERLSAEANAFPGIAVFSHETLARARKKRIKQAISAFNTDDVQVVLTTRDLARQLPAMWQEQVKNRNEQTYDDFLAEVFAAANAGDKAKRVKFWRPQDLVGLTERWVDIVGADKVTIVTVPRPGAERQELWRRFATATELPDLRYDFDLEQENVSLGVVEAELLRRLNSRLPDDLDWPQYETRIKRRFAEHTLAPAEPAARLAVPEKWHAQIAEISAGTIDYLRGSGCRVVGDLEDLRSEPAAPEGPMPHEVTDGEVLDLALRILGTLAARPLPGRASPATLSRRARTMVQRAKRRLSS